MFQSVRILHVRTACDNFQINGWIINDIKKKVSSLGLLLLLLLLHDKVLWLKKEVLPVKHLENPIKKKRSKSVVVSPLRAKRVWSIHAEWRVPKNCLFKWSCNSFNPAGVRGGSRPPPSPPPAAAAAGGRFDSIHSLFPDLKHLASVWESWTADVSGSSRKAAFRHELWTMFGKQNRTCLCFEFAFHVLRTQP